MQRVKQASATQGPEPAPAKRISIQKVVKTNPVNLKAPNAGKLEMNKVLNLLFSNLPELPKDTLTERFKYMSMLPMATSQN